MSSSRKIVKKECVSCCKKRALKWFAGDSTECVDCNFNTILSGDYKRCRMCRNWMKELKSRTLCEKCVVLNEKYNATKRKRHGHNKKDELHECPGCGEFASMWKWCKKSKSCIKCGNKKKYESEGKRKCNCCRCYRDIESFADFAECEKCRNKNKKSYHMNKHKYQTEEFKKKNAERARNYYWENSSFRREYRKYYYYNVFKPQHTRLVTLQWCLGLAKKRRVNRDGYWYNLNRALFKSLNKPKIQSQITHLENKIRNNSRDLDNL